MNCRFNPFAPCLFGLFGLMLVSAPVRGAENQAAAHFRKDIQPILAEYCYDCHGDGMKKGEVAFDQFDTDASLLGRNELWWTVLKNLRAGLMPPEKKPRPTPEATRRLEHWIKYEAFGLDRKDPDPGRVTIRRLNRVEYRNTIRDLMGIEFKADDEFPPDDTGYGFDNIGDVLTVSPLLLEKYMQAAETIVASAVPTVAKVVQEKSIAGSEFRGPEGAGNGERMTFYQEAKVSHAFKVDQAGDYRLLVELNVAGQFDFDPGRCAVVFKAGDRELLRQEFGWQNNKRFRFEFDQPWPSGEQPLSIELQPLTPAEKKVNSLDLGIVAVRVQGPLDERHWVRPKNFALFFTRDVPANRKERQRYAREVLERFAQRAFRRPADGPTVDRLLAIADGVSSQPGKKFEEGIGQAMVATLASPRFLFRVEEPAAGRGQETGARKSSAKLAAISSLPRPPKAAPIDEYALASRLSYFLWSTMPDEELFRLAARGELRKNLAFQVKRMLADARTDALIQNFTGQWLQARDVDGIDINARVILARDGGQEKEMRRENEEFRALVAGRQAQTNSPALTNAPSLANPQVLFNGLALTNGPAATNSQASAPKPQNRPRRFFNRPAVELDGPLRRAMRQETEMFFGHVVREDRSVLELIDSDYTFLNERLAKHYGIADVSGNEMRRVALPKDSPRGGLLTQGTVLVVTSNPTRTSPVKRGLFLLDNFLGTPPPPPPAVVPDLEESEKEFKDREPSLREVLELHRGKPLCNSCHNRMDPLGLALENFNALGMWREKERGQSIDAAGKLITGEAFQSIRDVKRILAQERHRDFYRCFSEKLLTYALGRGLEYYDVETVDQIVDRLERDQGRFSALLMGIVESAPFQKRRLAPVGATPEPPKTSTRKSNL